MKSPGVGGRGLPLGDESGKLTSNGAQGGTVTLIAGMAGIQSLERDVWLAVVCPGHEVPVRPVVCLWIVEKTFDRLGLKTPYPANKRTACDMEMLVCGLSF